nr:MAG TPA: hypothetical protein [Caudoviricetes sp.]
MTKNQAKELLKVINNWCFQRYDGRLFNIQENEYGIRIFELLPKYKRHFPENCFYTGPVYRKMSKGANCPTQLVSCSSKKGANEFIGFLSIPYPRYYTSTCKDGYVLHDIIVYLMNLFNIPEPT